jgi:tetratricopeptide (TPR) repeat protein
MGLIELKRNNVAAARDDLEQLQEILTDNTISAIYYKPTYKFFLHLSAKILAQEGRIDEANQKISDLEWIKNKLGYWSTAYDRAFFYDAIGEIFETMNQTENAESSYREALEYNPHYALASFHLSRLLYNIGLRDPAGQVLDHFLADWNDADPDAKELIEARAIKNSINN